MFLLALALARQIIANATEVCRHRCRLRPDRRDRVIDRDRMDELSLARGVGGAMYSLILVELYSYMYEYSLTI